MKQNIPSFTGNPTNAVEIGTWLGGLFDVLHIGNPEIRIRGHSWAVAGPIALYDCLAQDGYRIVQVEEHDGRFRARNRPFSVPNIENARTPATVIGLLITELRLAELPPEFWPIPLIEE